MSVSRESSIAPAAAQSRPPGVLQVLPALVTGGVERGTVDLARALVEAGWKAFVASAGGPLVRELERAGATHVTLPLDSKNPFVMYRNVDRLGEVLARQPIDLVHARSRAPAWSARAAARHRGLPFVTTFHGTYNIGSPLKRLYNGVMAGGDRVIAISDFIADHVRANYQVPAGRLVTIPRGIDLTRFDPARIGGERMIDLAAQWRLPDGVPVVLLPGRLSRWKGQLVLVEAMAELVAERGAQRVLALIVGDDQGRSDYRREVEQAIERRGLAGAVRLVGHCKDMPAAYMLADVVVSASTDPEAFGRVAVEAQAMGRPVIATAIGGARETVKPGVTGWLVAPGDAPALARAIGAALSLDPAQRQALAAAARAHVAQSYSVQRMCAATIELYTELLVATWQNERRSA
jgi:glycosyltransferase involved in cell wall biosynthesis